MLFHILIGIFAGVETHQRKTLIQIKTDSSGVAALSFQDQGAAALGPGDFTGAGHEQGAHPPAAVALLHAQVGHPQAVVPVFRGFG